MLMVSGAGGVVISSGDGSGNTSAPGDDPGWANVGTRGGATAVYLGNRYVITANHVGAGSVVLGGTTYSMEPGTEDRIQNPGGLGLSTNTDLLMFRLNVDPGLPYLPIANASPTIGTDLVMVGRGRNRGAFTMWDIDTGPDPDVWSTTLDGGLADVTGWTAVDPKTKRWGENEVENFATVDLGPVHGEVLSLYTKFDEVGLTHEAQGTNGDSGGAVFFKEGGIWKLGGIMNAVGTDGTFPYNGSPPGEVASNPYPYFGRVTTAADLSRYRAEITSLVPEPGSLGLLILACSLFGLRRRS